MVAWIACFICVIVGIYYFVLLNTYSKVLWVIMISFDWEIMNEFSGLIFIFVFLGFCVWLTRKCKKSLIFFNNLQKKNHPLFLFFPPFFDMDKIANVAFLKAVIKIFYYFISHLCTNDAHHFPRRHFSLIS